MGASPHVPMNHVLSGLHDKAHSMGAGTEGHAHSMYGVDTFTHQTPHTAEEHVAHLKHSHGLTDEEIGEGAPEGGFSNQAAHLAQTHDSLHDHSEWGHAHSGHKDVGKPFTGHVAPSGMSEHLIKHHGISPEESHLWGEHHGELHKAKGEALDHQHVPTIAPDVKTPEQLAKEAMHKHLKEDHGYTGNLKHTNGDIEHASLHNPEDYGYAGHPGHEHADNSSVEMTQKLPQAKQQLHHWTGENPPSGHHFHLQHGADMDPDVLKLHMSQHHEGGSVLDAFTNFDSHEQTLQKHAQAHATGNIAQPHTHAVSQSGHDELGRQLYGGKEPEPQYNIHPAIENDSQALAHIIKHHPNISAEDYNLTKGDGSSKLSMVDYHHKLHHAESGYALSTAPDGHTHADSQGPHTDIPIGSHLVSHHGLTQDQVASMTPAEFKAHHEELHARHTELDLGHGHVVPGGPVREPKTLAPNPHHAEMRDDLNHPAVHEWYHGTKTDYDGPPKNATELQEDHGFWGNFGGGDWNNHAGTHWTSLHQMARHFNGGPNRVIHAKLHMANPITYNSLNHMSHDAYDRLHASGDLQDDGAFLGRHDDDNGYNHCCSGRLLAYAKGEHRSDGKFGMERYRDSLRASGHDGIVVRNQADSPTGHWNAIPLSADQIEVTHASCHQNHNDERDSDTQEFYKNENKLKKGWVHPKPFNAMDYTGGKPLPSGDEVTAAGEKKKEAPPAPHIREGRGVRRGDNDPYRQGRDLGADSDDEDDESHYCEHCEEWGNHDSDYCDNKWCSVCDEHGDHTASEEHDHCDHCDDYADHSSDDHEDEWGEHPDKIKPEGYCPHCEENTKENYGKSTCVNCGEDLPNWGKKVASGTAVKPHEYKSDGETDTVNYGDAKNAPSIHSTHFGPGADEHDLATHLYHHHKSDVGGKEFEDSDGQWDGDKLQYHHQHLHADPQWATSQGFTVDHDHKSLYPQFKAHEDMTPTEVHAHMLLAHTTPKDGGSVGHMPLMKMADMTPEEAVHHHKLLHAADDAIEWGQKDSDGDLIGKISHSHQVPKDTPSMAPPEHSPQGEELDSHLSSVHGLNSSKLKGMKAFKENPDLLGTVHQQMHDNYGLIAVPGSPKYHTHVPEHGGTKKQMLDHLAEHHGITEDHALHSQFHNMTAEQLATAHDQEHNSLFPMGDRPEHSHSANNPNVPGWMSTGKQAARRAVPLTLSDIFKEVLA